MELRDWPVIIFISFFILTGCSPSTEAQKSSSANGMLDFDIEAGSISVPDGFEVILVADNLGNARHLCVDAAGDVYVNLGREKNQKGLVALRDSNTDGIADQIKYFGSGGGTAVLIHDGYLYHSTKTQVFRQALNADDLEPSGTPERILTLPRQFQHGSKALAFDGKGNMYVVIGAPSNACQLPARTAGVAGQDPCPLLETSGGIWQFSASQENQTFKDGTRYASGIRNAVGVDWNEDLDRLYAMQHGRDQLHQFWPEIYSEAQSSELPSEEMLEIQPGDNFGWPYCYYDHQKSEKLLAPEYGGDGSKVERCSQYEKPIIAFPGHWAPNSLKFYQGANFPSRFKNGAFIAFHGSWNRAPFPQEGYKVVFVPFSDGKPTGNYEDFATDFAADGDQIDSPGEAEYRPCGLAFGPDGSLYVCDSSKGRVWRIIYTGN